MNQIFVSDMNFKDEKGRERLFNGINFVHKGHQDESGKMSYIPDWDERQFEWCKQQGLNLIRLGIIWDGLEHEQGQYDEAYLAWVEKVLGWCQKYEIYVYLDMHQDLYSCVYGDGAPEWATLSEGRPHVDGDLWSDAYLFSEAVKRAYQNFWENKEVADGMGLQDYYVKVWSYVVERFKDHPAVIGFDFLNEPFPGESALEIFGTLLGAYGELTQKDMSLEELVGCFADPSAKANLLEEFSDKHLYSQMTQAAEPLLKVFDTQALAAFYHKMTTAIRKLTNKGIIMQENSYFSNLGIPCNIPVITNEAGEKEPLQAYAPHGYDLVVDTADIVYANNERVDVIFDTHRLVQEKLNVPVIVGEWGAHGNYSEGLGHIEHLLAKFEDYKWSHTYWCYHGGIESAPVMRRLSRPYPQAVCGDLIKYHLDRENQVFEMLWEEKADVMGETIVYLPTHWQELSWDGIRQDIQVEENESGYLLKIPKTGNAKRNLRVIW